MAEVDVVVKDTNGQENGSVPEIELIIKVSIAFKLYFLELYSFFIRTLSISCAAYFPAEEGLAILTVRHDLKCCYQSTSRHRILFLIFIINILPVCDKYN